MEKKNNLTIVAFVVIIIVIIVVLILNNINNKPKTETTPIAQGDAQIEQAILIDSTKAITENLNNINIEDTTDAELNIVDQELEKL